MTNQPGQRNRPDPSLQDCGAGDSPARRRLPQHLQASLAAAEEQRRQGYRGRFAPSPTGSLHRGNLRTALLSWLEARRQGGEWLLRLDDLDTPRNRPGAEEAILADLRWLGLDWDGPLIRQSERRGLYASALSALRLAGCALPLPLQPPPPGRHLRSPWRPVDLPGPLPGRGPCLGGEQRAAAQLALATSQRPHPLAGTLGTPRAPRWTHPGGGCGAASRRRAGGVSPGHGGR